MMMGSVACVYNNFKMKHNNMMWHHNIAAAAAPEILPILSSGSLQVMRNNILYNYTVAPIYLLNVSNVWCVRLHSKEYPCPSPSVDDVMRIICKIIIIYYLIDSDNSSYMCNVCVCVHMYGMWCTGDHTSACIPCPTQYFSLSESTHSHCRGKFDDVFSISLSFGFKTFHQISLP